MLNETVVEFPPPGLGLETRTLATPAIPTRLAGIAAVSCVALTKVVGSRVPPKETWEPETKLVPFTVSVSAPLFWITKTGDIDEMVGSGLLVWF